MNVEQLRDLVKSERERIKERHRFGVSGSEIVEENTKLADNLIRHIHHTARDEGMLPESIPLAVTALGGYGRREMNPYSDVDIMVLVEANQKSQKSIASFASHLVGLLWDIGFEVGHSTRAIRDCVRILREDTVSRTSLLEARFIVGSKGLFQDFEKRMEKTLFKRGVSPFIDSKVEEWRERIDTYGSSIYIQEPEIKQSMGGLRDVHTIFWIARARYGIRELHELPDIRILSSELADLIREALDFLWRVRNELHFLKGRKQDQLTFELQSEAAHNLGYEDVDQQLAEEQLMQDYYRHAQCVSHLAELVVDRAHRTPSWKSWLHRRRQRTIAPAVFVRGNTLHIDPSEASPATYIDLFRHQQAEGLALHPDTRDAVREFAAGLTDESRQSEEMANAFLKLMQQPDGVADALRSMHELGFLKAYMPEFGPLEHLVRRDYYHRYTLDEHTFLAIENLDASTLDDLPYGEPIRDTIGSVEQPELIRLALLFHDMGIPAGGPKDHDVRSTELAGTILKTLGLLGPGDIERVQFLVRYHLLMSRTSQQRDLDDPDVVQRFVEVAKDEERLRMLYLLTFADMRAVNVEIWNEWNAALLSQLYMRSLQWMSGSHAETMRQRNELIAETQQLLVTRDVPEARIQRHFDTMPERAWIGMDAAEIAQHVCIIEELQNQPFILKMNHQHTDYAELIICTRDSRSLFHKITGVLAASHINILSAQLYTREDGIALDVFTVAGAEGASIAPEQIPDLRTDMTNALVDDFDLSQLDAPAEVTEMERRGMASQVSINNEDSQEFTIIDIHTQDRLGLLYAITGVFSELGLQIFLAKISTEAHSVADAFYVLDSRHRKISALDQQEKVRKAIAQVLP